MDYEQGFQKALGTLQEIQAPAQLFLLAYRHLVVGLAVKKKYGLFLAPVSRC